MTLVREVMTRDPVVMPSTSLVTDAARVMRDQDIGDVLVRDNEGRIGMVTDRDIVVRGLASGRSDVQLREIVSDRLYGVAADADTGDAVDLMRDRAVRRAPVVEGNRVVGIVTIGDLARERDPGSALGGISAAPPNR